MLLLPALGITVLVDSSVGPPPIAGGLHNPPRRCSLRGMPDARTSRCTQQVACLAAAPQKSLTHLSSSGLLQREKADDQGKRIAHSAHPSPVQQGCPLTPPQSNMHDRAASGTHAQGSAPAGKTGLVAGRGVCVLHVLLCDARAARCSGGTGMFTSRTKQKPRRVADHQHAKQVCERDRPAARSRERASMETVRTARTHGSSGGGKGARRGARCRR